MSTAAAVSLSVSRPLGRTLVVAAAANRPATVELLRQLGYAAGEADDPYAAVLELCRRPHAYQSVVLGLTSLFREELPVITTIKRRFPTVEVWLAQTDGRPAAMAEALRLGADGLVGEDGLHRLGVAPPAAAAAVTPPAIVVPPVEADDTIEPLLSADELRALLEETSP